MANQWSDEAIEKMRRLGLLTAVAESMKPEPEDRPGFDEGFFDEEALWEQFNHDRHVAGEDAAGVPDDQR